MTEIALRLSPRYLNSALALNFPANQLKVFVILDQLLAFQKGNRALPPSPFGGPELPLDRILLHSSRSYRTNRRLAWELGVQFELKRSAFRSFHTHLERKVTYVPFDADLLWGKLPRSLKKIEEAAERLVLASDGTVSVFHELSHFILVRSMRPASGGKKTRQEVLEFFDLIESLAFVRDVELIRELTSRFGNAVQALQAAGIVCKPGIPFRARGRMRLSYLEFKALLSARRVLRTGANVSAWSAWLDVYLEKFGDRVPLPVDRRMAEQYDWIAKRGERSSRALFEWYAKLFHSDEEAKPSLRG